MKILDSKLSINLKKVVLWTVFSVIIGGLSALASSMFLHSIDWAIEVRRDNSWMILFLPLVGFIVSWVYLKIGREVESGNNLIIDEIHTSTKPIPLRMLPMIFVSSILSHLFGASVGREGAAVQMSGAISDQFFQKFGSILKNRRLILMMGMSAGFSSIFGAPMAGAIFGLEVLMIGAIAYEAFIPCILAATMGYYGTILLNIHHPIYYNVSDVQISWVGIISAMIAGICFGLAAKLFISMLKLIKMFLKKFIKTELLHPVFGGVIMVMIFYAFHTDRYHSLGLEVIKESFEGKNYSWDFLAKTMTTTLSVGSGFRGGEVMSLFYIGATLGSTLSAFLPLASGLLAALGFVAVFAGALNVPIAALVLSFELFGSEIGVYAALAISMSYLFSGKIGIYSSQKTHIEKEI